MDAHFRADLLFDLPSGRRHRVIAGPSEFQYREYSGPNIRRSESQSILIGASEM
jgi:hypothetical protein